MAFLAVENEEAVDLAATRGYIRRSVYTLANAQNGFERMCASSLLARQYFEKGRAIYPTVGLKTLLDATLQ